MPKYDEPNERIRCSFCGKTQDQVAMMIQGPGAYICDECVDNCLSIIHESGKKSSSSSRVRSQRKLPKPVEIKTKLDEYVIGQDDAKTALSVAVYNHYKRIFKKQSADVEIVKSNILLLGPTGVGKTFLAQTLAKILEGTDASVPPQGGRKHPQQELIHINTNNILFICAGAFVGLDKIVADRIGKRGVGFSGKLGTRVDEDQDALMASVMPQDLHKFGMIPEFVGRIPVITTTQELTEDDLVEILTTPRNAIVKQYKRMFQIEGVALEFEDEALREVARQAIARKTGARGLRSVCESVLQDVMFDLPSDLSIARVVVTRESVLGLESPRLERRAEMSRRLV